MPSLHSAALSAANFPSCGNSVSGEVLSHQFLVIRDRFLQRLQDHALCGELLIDVGVHDVTVDDDDVARGRAIFVHGRAQPLGPRASVVRHRFGIAEL